MRFVRILGLAVVAALALMAFYVAAASKLAFGSMSAMVMRFRTASHKRRLESQQAHSHVTARNTLPNTPMSTLRSAFTHIRNATRTTRRFTSTTGRAGISSAVPGIDNSLKHRHDRNAQTKLPVMAC